MHLCDSNVWLALVLSGHTHHAACRDWFDSVVAPASVIFCRATQQSLLQLLTNATVLAPYGNPPLTNNEAWNVYGALVGDDRIVLATDEPAGTQARWKAYALRDDASPKLWMDAYLGAFARAAGYQLVTTDKAFEQFGGLETVLLGRAG